MSDHAVGTTAALTRARRRGRALRLGALVLSVVVVALITVVGGPTSGPSTQAASAGRTARLTLVDTPATHGQVLFGRYCDSCHPGAGSGVGSDLRTAQVRRQYPTPDSIKLLVRAGGFDMPAFPTQMLSDDELTQIASYLESVLAEVS